MSKELFMTSEVQRIERIRTVCLITVIILGAIALLLPALSLLFVPFVSAALAYVYAADKTKKRWLSLLLSVLLISLDLILNFGGSVFAFATVLLALFTVVWFVRNAGKSFCIGVSTVTLSFLLLLFLYMIAFSYVGVDFEAATEFLRTEAQTLRTTLETTLNAILSVAASEESIATLISDGIVGETVDLYMAMLPSFLVIFALAITAGTHFVFLLLVGATSKVRMRKTEMFSTSAVFAVFFIILSIFNMFESDDSAFSIALLNLYYVFLVIYAYLGFRFVSYVFGKRIKSIALSIIILLVVSALFSGFALNLFSIVGVFETFAVARMFIKNVDKGGNDLE